MELTRKSLPKTVRYLYHEKDPLKKGPITGRPSWARRGGPSLSETEPLDRKHDNVGAKWQAKKSGFTGMPSRAKRRQYSIR